MTPRCGVRTALTEERSKAEIKPSALRRSDEKKSSYPHQKKQVGNRALLLRTVFRSILPTDRKK